MSQFFHALNHMPVPLFGNTRMATSWAIQKSKHTPHLFTWALPAFVGGMWLVWPAVSDEFKIDMGLKKDPEKEAENFKKEMEERIATAAVHSMVMSDESKRAIAEKVKLDMIAREELEKTARERDQIVRTGSLNVTGEQTAEWENFMKSSIQPGEDDEEEDEDDDEEEDDDDEVDNKEDDEDGSSDAESTEHTDNISASKGKEEQAAVVRDKVGNKAKTGEVDDDDDDDKWFTC